MTIPIVITNDDNDSLTIVRNYSTNIVTISFDGKHWALTTEEWERVRTIV